MRKKADGNVMTAEEEISACTDDLTKMLGEFETRKATANTEQKSWMEAREKEIREFKDEMETMRKAQADALRKISPPGSEDAAAKFSLGGFMKSMWTGQWDGNEADLELINQIHKSMGRDLIRKDIIAGTGSTGGFLLPIQVVNEIIPLALPDCPVYSTLGITKVTNLAVGEYRMPKQTARSTAYWVGENAAPGTTSPTFDVRVMRARKVAAVTFVSNDMLRQGRGDMESFVRKDLGDAIVQALEKALIYGSGTDYTPKGLFNSSTNVANYAFSTTSAIGSNGGQYGFTNAAGQVNVIRKANLLRGNLAYLFHPDVLYGLQITRAQMYTGQTGDGLPILPGTPLLSDEELKRMLRGMNFGTTTLHPANLSKGSGVTLAATVFGDWSQYVLGLWTGLEISLSKDATVNGTSAFAQDGFFTRALQLADITVRDEAAFSLIPDCKTASLSMFPGT